MSKIKNIISNLEFKSMIKPMLVLFVLCVIYNLLYIFSAYQSAFLSFALMMLLCLVSSIGYYYLCIFIWGNKKISSEDILGVLVFQAALIFIVAFVLTVLYAYFKSGIIYWITQIISVIGLVCIPPLQLVYFHALYKGNYTMNEIVSYIKKVMKTCLKPIWNGYCAVLLLIFLGDTLVEGIFSLSSGFDAYYLLYRGLFSGNPFFQFIMFVFTQLLGFSDISYTILSLVLGCIYAFFEVNFIGFLNRKCLESWKSQS